MKAALISLSAALVCGPALATKSHTVDGYTKKDGTYVAPHQQTNPNGTKADNYSSKPNVNPYTGAPGTADPLKPVTPKK
jgi:hypothetical protein